MGQSAQEPPAPAAEAAAPAAGGGREFRRRNWTKADIYVLPTSPPTLVKDYRRRSWPVRIYGRICLNHEERALRRLAGLKGVPALYGREGPLVLSMEFIEAEPLCDLKKAGRVPQGFVDRLEQLLIAIEARGVAHADPHMRNILSDRDGQPYLVDFSTSHVRGRIPLLSGWIFHNLQVMRKLKVQKLRRKLCGEIVELDVKPGTAYRLVNRLGRIWQRLRRR